MSIPITPVILSGGAGTRLWPLSTAATPKQMLRLAGELTMLQATAARVADRARFAGPVVVANAAHADAIEAQLAAIGCPPDALVLEPAGRNTAPAIALAALAAPDALLLVMPSDHVIGDVDAFRAAIDRAAPLAEQDWLVTFGITPERPETGFGYIRLGDALAEGVHRVDRFVEKPPRADAERMVREGGYAWNGGIFLFRAQAYLDALAVHAPAMRDAVAAAMDGAQRSGCRVLPDPASFGASPADSIDYAVLEKAERVAVVPVAMAWSDVGSWDAVHGLGTPDGQGNVLSGAVVALDSADCMIRSDGPTVAALGVSDLIVVATRDQVLILPRGRSQEVKQLLDAVRARET
ncbi:mannose-1-phosphate guanylyltransferase/mannose-6-phosphate isomerase [Sphingomonas sp. MAH-20]|uniref:mannose-1-phosphate guanylyltransferase n=1 Tax=Sphingomonas horti TaxID=2682842 RepID=A0A6I4J4N7_9SPHN|nr:MULTISPECIES: mannose-1-phosphate guanylyltransferase/mannose-6-phosphate isomerase [Sphingomonas]MBA2921194.1 mannose-1-phosphate guanylyltransferase/mannose-6-phosphate isomerase [Sphingomonas sp. CGMCC 1.13658]MVO79435.1 mannose-1-phosphate guanylyltransferase/mannose-6-phosphate isomerase [Sphingomonas horti]